MKKQKRFISRILCMAMMMSFMSFTQNVSAAVNAFVYKTGIEYNMKNAVTTGTYRGDTGNEAGGIGDMSRKFILFKNVDLENGSDYMDIGYATTANQVVGVVVFDKPIETVDDLSIALNNVTAGEQKTLTYTNTNGESVSLDGTTIKEYRTDTGEIPITETWNLVDKNTFRVNFPTRQTGSKAVLLYTRSSINIYSVEFNRNFYSMNTEYSMKEAVTTGTYKGDTGNEAGSIGDTYAKYILFKEVDFENGCDLAEIGYAYSGSSNYTMNMYVLDEPIYSSKTAGADFTLDRTASPWTLTYTDDNGNNKMINAAKLGDINLSPGASWNLADKKTAAVKFNEKVIGTDSSDINSTKTGKKAVLIWCGPTTTNVYTIKFGSQKRDAYAYNSVKDASCIGNKEGTVKLVANSNEQYYLDTGNNKYTIFNYVDFGTSSANKLQISYATTSSGTFDIAIYDNPIVDTDIIDKTGIATSVNEITNKDGTKKESLLYQRFSLPAQTSWTDPGTEGFALKNSITGVKSVVVCTNTNLAGIEFSFAGFTNNTVEDKVWNVEYKNDGTETSFIIIKALFKDGILKNVELDPVTDSSDGTITRIYDFNAGAYSDYDRVNCMIFSSWDKIAPLVESHNIDLK